MNNTIIQADNLSKIFKYHEKGEGLKGSLKALVLRQKKTKEAVRDISFEIKRGEFVGFIGPNGAGKTTTLKMLSGILYPSNGSISVGGYDPRKRQDDFKRKISIVMGQKKQLWFTLPAIETYRLIQKIYDIPEKDYRRRLNELTELMDAADLLHVTVRKLSMGQRMKCELIAALLHEPEILFLDEPTIGLDVVSQKNIRRFLRDYNREKNNTIILTSHYMDDVQDLCERLIIINEGRIGYDGSVIGIINKYSNTKRVIVVFDRVTADTELAEVGEVIEHSGFEAKINIPAEKTKDRIALLVNKFPVKDISITGVTLEEVVEGIFDKQK